MAGGSSRTGKPVGGVVQPARMDDDALATVIPFPIDRVRSRPAGPAPEADAREEYWALVQRLAAERRDLGRGAG
jgi:hypothetical protein